MTDPTIYALYVDSGSGDANARRQALDRTFPRLSIDRATTAREARERVDRSSYDVLVCRHVLPEADGLSVLDELTTAADAPVSILLSDSVSEERLRDAYAAGVDDVVPLDSEDQAGETLGHRLEHHFETPRLPVSDGAQTENDARAENDAESSVDRSKIRRPARQLRSVADTTSDAILIIDCESTVLFANPALEDLLGYAPREVVGESLTMLMSDEFADRDRQALRRYLQSGDRRLDWENVELPARASDGTVVPMSISFTEFRTDGETYFTGILRDVSEKKELRSERELLHDVTQEITQAEDFDEGLGIALDAVGDAMNWAYGEAWVPDDENRLRRHEDEYLASEEYAPFRAASTGRAFGGDEGLPGRVWRSNEPEWIPNVSTASPETCPRTDAAQEVGLKAALCVPISADGEVVAVLVFLMPEHREADRGMIEATVGVAKSLGRLMRRIQAEAALRAESQLKSRILETSPVGIAILDADGTPEYVNDAAESILRLDSSDVTAPESDALDHRMLDETDDPLPPDDQPHARVIATGDVVQRTLQVEFEDGARRWLSVNGAPMTGDEGGVERSVLAFEDVTDRRERQAELERAEAMLEAACDGVYALDERGEYVGVNDAYAEFVGRSREELLGEPATAVTPERLGVDVDAIRSELEGSDRDAVTYETLLERDGGASIPVEVRLSLFPLDEESVGRVGLVRDISERKRRESRLQQLNEFAQALTTAETVQEVGDIAVESAQEILDLPLSTIELFDEETGTLTPLAATDEVADLVGDDSLFESERDAPWRSFSQQEARILDGVGSEPELPEGETPLESVIILPIEEYGVLMSGSTEPDAFDEEVVTLQRIFAATVSSALDRVEREAELRTRTEELEEQKRSLERVNHVNTVIREITRVLTQATSREEIEETVCTRLANAEPYRFAWIGKQRTIGGVIEPRASAGVDRGYLDEVTVTADDRPTGQGPGGRAVRTHEAQVQNNLHIDPPFEPWRREALQRGYRSSISVPLVHKETLYGVLNLYSETPEIFDDLEVTVLEELGEMIGYAMNALERKRALVSETAVQLEFQLAEGAVPAGQFARRHDATVELEALIEQTDDSLRAFFTVTGSTPEEVEACVEERTSVSKLNLITEREDGYFYESVVTEANFLARLLESGAHPTSLLAEPTGTELTVEMPTSGDIQAFLDMFLSTYETAELTARRELDRPVQTREEFQALYRERLTDRQEEVLRAAYYAGFFSWPRESSGSEVAEMLGVSQPTVNRHIRKGEAKLFDLVFEEGDGDPAP